MYGNQKSYNIKGDPFLQINCSMDMDSMEITKTKAIKKYEENSYLLGRIFEIEEKQNISKNQPKNDLTHKSKKEEKKSNQNKKNDIFTNKNNEGLDIIEFFEEKMEDADYDTEEKIDSAIREFSKIYEENKWEDKTLLNKLNEIYNNYKKEEDYLEKERAEFEKSAKKYENLISAFKNLKSNIELQDVIDLVKQCENEGYLLDKTKRDFEKFVEEYNNNNNNNKNNKNDDVDKNENWNMNIEDVPISQNEQELPFNHEEKIITFPI